MAPWKDSASSCFAGSALVLTPDGWEEIRAIKAGDEILSYDSRESELVARPVNMRLKCRTRVIWEIHADDLIQAIPTTSGHTFLTTRGWVATKHLRNDDELLTVSAGGTPSLSKITSVCRTQRKEPTYSLNTAGEHNFVAAGAVAHNFSYFRTFRTWWYQKFIDSHHVHQTTLVGISN